MSTERLIFVITDREHRNLKKLFLSWSRGYEKARNLKQFKLEQHNPHTLEMDDTDYTRHLASWLFHKYHDKIKVYSVKELDL